MSTVEKQLDHRIEIEKTGVKRSFNQSSTGQWMGFVIAIVFGFISWDLAKSGFTVVKPNTQSNQTKNPRIRIS